MLFFIISLLDLEDKKHDFKQKKKKKRNAVKVGKKPNDSQLQSNVESQKEN